MFASMQRSILDRARDHAVTFLDSLPERHVGPRADRAALLRCLDVPLTDEGVAEEAVLDDLVRGAARAITRSAGPRYVGCVIGGSYPVALAADWMTGVWDQTPGIFVTSPALAVVE